MRKTVSLALKSCKSFVSLFLLLSACSPLKKASVIISNDQKYQGHYKIGNPYTVNDQTYTPKQELSYDEIGTASWYGGRDGLHGKITANGDRYDKNALTAAHRTLPLPSMIKVTNLENNKSLIVMVHDRGPFRKNRILDLSECAAKHLGFHKQGYTKVRVEYLHHETQQLLHKLSLKPKHGSVALGKIKHGKCSVDCHVKKVNVKHKIKMKL